MHHIAIDDVAFDLSDRVFKTLLGKTGNKIGLHHAAAFHIDVLRCRAIQLLDQLIDAGLGLRVGSVFCRIGMHDQIQLTAQVVEHDHFLRHHQQDVRQLQRVCLVRGGQTRFDIANRVITKVTDQATGKLGQARRRRDFKRLLIMLDPGQRVLDNFFLLEDVILIQANSFSVNTDHLGTGQTDDGVSRPLLTALHGFE